LRRRLAYWRKIAARIEVDTSVGTRKGNRSKIPKSKKRTGSKRGQTGSKRGQVKNPEAKSEAARRGQVTARRGQVGFHVTSVSVRVRNWVDAMAE
jgi:hypothetical protein